jgi:glycosyltransferase involved in cell wall biosynthesis
MKICIVGPVYPYRGGIAHYTSRLAQALERHGHAIQVISFRRQYPALLYPGKTDKDPSSDAIRVPAQYILDPLYPWTWWQAAKLISGAKPDMALFQWWSTFWAPAYFGVARRLSPVPVAFLIHNVLPHESKPWDASLARLALGQGRGFIVQTARERERLQQLVAIIPCIPHSRTRLLLRRRRVRGWAYPSIHPWCSTLASSGRTRV